MPNNIQGVALFQAIFQQAGIGMALVSQTGFPIRCNHALEEMLGYSEQELCSMNFIEFTHPEDAGLDAGLFQELLDGKRTRYQIVKRYYRKDGAVVWGRLTASLVTESDGNADLVVGMVEDISQRKHAEEKLKDSRDQYQSLFNLSPDAIVIHSQDEILFINRAGLHLFGFDHLEAIKGRSIFDFVPKDYYDQMEQRLEEVEHQPYLLPVEQQLVRSDGSLVHVEVTSAQIGFDGQGAIQSVIRDVTNRKQSAQRLQEAQNRLSSILESITDAFFALDDQFQFTFINPQAERLLGFKRGNLIGKGLLDTFPNLKDSLFFNAYQKAFKDKETVSVTDFYAPRKRWFEVNVYPGDEGLSVYFRDITDKKTVEQALIESEERYRRLVELSPLPIGTHKDGKFIYMNSAGCRALGALNQQELIGKSVLDIVHPDYVELVKGHVNVRGKDLAHTPIVEQKLIRLDGEIIDVEIMAVVTEDTQGDPIMQVVFHDITERNQAMQALKDSEERYKSLFMNNLDMVFSIDKTGRIRSANPSCGDVIGFNMEELLHMNFISLIDPVDQEAMMESFQRVISGEPQNVETTIISKDKERIRLTVNSMPMEVNREIIGLFGIARDVTEQRLAERKLNELTTELIRSNADLQQFAYIASHDLQEPLRMVSSYLQLIEKRYKNQLPDDAQDFIGFAVDGAKRMQTLIMDLLSYSRVNTKEKEVHLMDGNLLFERARQNLETLIQEKGAKITWDPLPELQTDGTQLIQLFQNLLANAMKFTKDRLPVVHLSVKSDENQWIIGVHDNGIGIASEHQERIFSIFQRLNSKGDYPGNGIGLAICKRIVERHGGQIWVESTPGEGTTFYFTLPNIKGERQHVTAH